MSEFKVLITGGQLYGNLGSAAMAIVTIEYLKERFPEAQILFVSKYFEGESRNLCRFFGSQEAVRLVRSTQLRATFIDLPLLIIDKMLGTPNIACRLSHVVQSFEQSDIVIDIGGITFSEERELIGLLINITWVLLPTLVGKPIVKLSQAFGHIRKRWFRFISRVVLRNVDLLIARGKTSVEELETLDLQQEIYECADLAFLLQPEETENTRHFVSPEGILVGVAPSSVMFGKLGGQPYIELMTTCIEWILTQYEDSNVWICAHAFREGDMLSNNDGPICRQIYDNLPQDMVSRTRSIVGNYTPGEMRVIIGRTDVFLASRFHAMVSALAMGVPVMVFGWSHKYKEVQAQFDLDDCIDQKASAETLCQALAHIIARRHVIRERILSRLPSVVQSSRRNLEILSAFIDTRKNL